MGAWGIKALENDYALDEMMDILDVCTTPEATIAYTTAMLNNWRDEHILFLGICFVDAGINAASHAYFGKMESDIKKFLCNLPDMSALRDKALRVLPILSTDSWNDDCKEQRQRLYDELRMRLEP